MWLTELTPEQEALIPVYREKWKAIALSTEPIERKRAKKAVKTAYAAIDLKEPNPREWQVQWLIEEDNAELRRILIQEIGYARICQELQVSELDYWQEYTLLKIDDIKKDDVVELNEDENVEQIAIYLLKMTCPSTGFVHALRVPPDMKSAREAIRWVNWGIDPEEFGVQT